MDTLSGGRTKRLLHGAVYKFQCTDPGAELEVGSPTIFCDGRNWNDTQSPVCSSEYMIY